MDTRCIYESSNGDTWELIRDGDRVRVRHTPNRSCGGSVTDYELEAFLGRERHTPQVGELIRLIGTLAEGQP